MLPPRPLFRSFRPRIHSRLPVKEAVRKAIGKKAGDIIHVALVERL
jgi:hypothetical protein